MPFYNNNLLVMKKKNPRPFDVEQMACNVN